MSAATRKRPGSELDLGFATQASMKVGFDSPGPWPHGQRLTIDLKILTQSMSRDASGYEFCSINDPKIE
jgi:hypothetical protein